MCHWQNACSTCARLTINTFKKITTSLLIRVRREREVGGEKGGEGDRERKRFFLNF